MLKLLYKTIGLSFYQQHAGLFLVVLYLLFGAVEGSQLIGYHKAILMAICSSPIILGSLFLIWTLYAIKAFFFVKKKLSAAEYQFLSLITSISYRKQQYLWIRVYIFIMLPILIYAVLIIVTAIKIQSYFTLLFLPIALMSLIWILSIYTFRITNLTYVITKEWISLSLKIKKPFWTWPLFYLFTEQRLTMVIVKVVSIFFFKAVLFMLADVGNDVRVYLTAILAVVLSHAVLVFNLIKFNAFYLAFTKTLPISTFRNLANSCLVYFLILLPEFSLLGWLEGFNITNLSQCILFGIATMLALQLTVYTIKADMERYLKYLLFLFFIAMMSILAGYAVLYSLTLTFIAGLLFFLRHAKIDLKTIA
jgi:hypothetical protein